MRRSRAALLKSLSPPAGFLAIAVALGAVGLSIEQRMRAEVRAQATAQLAAIADLKVDQIAAWRAERLADVTAIAAPPVGAAELARLARGDLPAPVAAWYRSIQARHVYADVLVVAPGGEVVFSTSGDRGRLDPVTAATAARAALERRGVLSDLHRGPGDGRVILDAAAPISPDVPGAALVLRTDAATFLFPRVQDWPAPSATAETLLVRRDGDDVLFLNELRHERGTALSLRFPLSRADLPAARAALGETGTREGLDYRGEVVLAELRAVPDSPWRLVAKVDRDEIFATERHLAWAAGAATGAFLILAALLALAWRRQQQAAMAAAERRSTEEALHHRAELLESLHDAVVATDVDARITAWNPAAERVYGYAEAEAIGRRFPELLATEHSDGQSRAWMLEQLARHGRVELNVRQRRKDGTPVEIEATLVVRKGPGGKFLGYIGVNRDVTARRGAEAELRRVRERLALADRMASVGRLAAGVAHEINNPLAYVLSSLAAAEEDAAALGGEAAPALREALRDARDGAERVRRIVGDLKSLSRPDEAARGPVDVREVLDVAVNLARHEIRHRARVVRRYGEVPPVEANEARLAQAFLNLVVNAAQAIGEGNADANEIVLATRVEGGRVCVDVTDSGPGIPPEIQARVFDPFFTTKPVGVGTGLGLAISHGIITSSGGEIRVDSGPGRGATFTVTLPAARAGAVLPAPRPAPEPAAPAAGGRRGRVLVVDDEPAVARSLKRILSRDHDVVAVPGGRAALDLIAGGERFDAILCDLMMPEVTGMDLYERLAKEAPETARAMVFMTGGAFTPRARAFLVQTAPRSFEKPFETEAVRAIVREVVGA